MTTTKAKKILENNISALMIKKKKHHSSRIKQKIKHKANIETRKQQLKELFLQFGEITVKNCHHNCTIYNYQPPFRLLATDK